MSLKSLGGRCHRSLWGLWFLALLVTLILPATREAQVRALRAFFHLSGGQTTVSPGGHTYFTDSYRDRCKAAAGDSPDGYLTTSSVLSSIGPFPPAKAWASDPLLPWAAIKSAERMDYAQRIATDRPLSPSDPQLDESIQTTLELVGLARQVEPENGLIWLAEATARFARGEDDAGLAALEVALQKKWNDHQQEVALRTERLLEAAGIPAFDATLPILASFNPVYSVRICAWHHLTRLLSDAVRRSDETAFAHRLGLLRDLLAAGFEKPFVPLLRIVHNDQDLMEAMAASQGVTLPPRDLTTTAALKARREAVESVCNSYLRLHVPATAESILCEDLQCDAERERRFQARHDPETRHLMSLLKVEFLQKLALVIIGGFLAALVAGVLAWRWPPEWRDGKKLHLHREFLFGLIPTFALMCFCVWPVVQCLQESENISADCACDPSYHPLLTRAQKDMLASAALAALPLLILISGPAGRALYRAGLVVGAYSYLAAIIAGAFFRHDVVAAAATMIAA